MNSACPMEPELLGLEPHQTLPIQMFVLIIHVLCMDLVWDYFILDMAKYAKSSLVQSWLSQQSPPVHAKLPMFIYAAARCICTCSETWFTEQVYFCRIFLQPFRKLTKAACAIFMVPIHRSNFLKEAQLRWYYLMAADKHYDILTMKPLRTSYYIIYVRR